MGKTKPQVPREQKRQDIVRVARALFMHDGYEQTSMQRLAREAEIAPNTLYWYFADKDALLIAVLGDALQEGLRAYAKQRTKPVDAQLRWLLKRLASTRGLMTTVHARMEASDAIRTWHEGFHRVLEETIEDQLRAQGLSVGHEPAAARAVSFIVEGMLVHECGPAEQKRILHWLRSLVETDRALHAADAVG